MENNDHHRQRVFLVALAALITASLVFLRSQSIEFHAPIIGNVPRPQSDEDILYNGARAENKLVEITIIHPSAIPPNSETTIQPNPFPNPRPTKSPVPVPKPKVEVRRLPDSIEPVEYNLRIKTNLPGYGYKATDGKNLTFEGEVSIDFLVKKATSAIVLNALDLNISEVQVLTKREGKVDAVGIKSGELDIERNELKITLGTELPEGTAATIVISFDGMMRRDMNGLYLTEYVQNGEPKLAAVTQFEPVSARLLVPCFDEPAFKAVWKVSIVHPEGTRALSNMRAVQSTKFSDEFTITVFKETPKMSTYLLAFFVSEFHFNELSTKSGVQVRVWSRPEALNTTKYAVDAGVKCLDFYENYFGIKFPMIKLDMVAIPDFSAGAMENWGLILYRETDLLYDPSIYTGNLKRRVALVIAHELAHQWFGNLMTMKWWKDLWLNEGFATFIEDFGIDHISDGNFMMKEERVRDTQSIAFAVDSVSSSHPLSVRIDQANEILDYFDSITYQKGASVIHMISRTIGEENFKNGIQHFLNEYSYANADVDDLFVTLNEKVSGKIVMGPDGNQLDIHSFADPWLKQLGYPLLTVSRLNSTHIIVTQERFRLSKDTKELEKFRNPKWGFKWDVPVWYQQVDTDGVQMKWLRRDRPLIIESEDLVIFNIDSDGFYRVNYSPELWEAVIVQLETRRSEYSSRTVTRLIDDAFKSAYIGIIDYSIPIRLLKYFRNEEHFLPLDAAMNNIGSILTYYGKDEKRKIIYRFLKELLVMMIPDSRIPYKTAYVYLNDRKFEEVNIAMLHIGMKCMMKETGCMKYMSNAFEMLLLNKCEAHQMTSRCSQVIAPFRALAYCHGVEAGGDKVFQQVVEWYKIEKNQLEKLNLLRALTCTNDLNKLEKLLLDNLKPETSMVRTQDVHILFAKAADNYRIPEDFLLNFLIKNWNSIKTGIPVRSLLQSVIGFLCSDIRTPQQLEKLKKFMADTPSTANYQFKEIVDRLGVKIQWIDTHYDHVLNTFKQVHEEILSQKN